MSHSLSNVVVAVALGAVAIALFLGLANMMRGGSTNRTQTLMRWRIGLQFAALLIILGVLWLRG